MSRTECARQGAETIGAKTRRREVHPVSRTIRSVPFTGLYALSTVVLSCHRTTRPSPLSVVPTMSILLLPVEDSIK
eukprot:2478401-Prymnesium_polylepis.1